MATPPSAVDALYDSSSDEEYTFKGVRLRGRRTAGGGTGDTSSAAARALGRRARVQPIPSTAAGLPGVLLNPEDRIAGVTDEADGDTQTPGSPGGVFNTDGNLEITPLVLHNDLDKRRHRSALALEAGRQKMFTEFGIKPRLVEDNQTGYVLPRDHIVDIRPPKMKVDERGNVQLVASRGDDLGPDEMGDEEDANTKVHYKRSIDIVRDLRQMRLLRELEEEDVDLEDDLDDPMMGAGSGAGDGGSSAG